MLLWEEKILGKKLFLIYKLNRIEVLSVDNYGGQWHINSDSFFNFLFEEKTYSSLEELEILVASKIREFIVALILGIKEI